MPIATFHNKVFQVSARTKRTLNGLEWSGDLDTEAQEKLKDKPSTYIKGMGLNTMSFDFPLRVDFGMNVRLEIQQWEAIRDKAIAYNFILGSKPLGKNKWLLKSVGVSETEIDGKGQIRKALLKLSFEEYVRAGKATEAKKKGKKKSAPGKVNSNSTLVPNQYIDKSDSNG